VSADIKRNASYIQKQMAEAKEKGAEVYHFPESSLSGYAGTDFKPLELSLSQSHIFSSDSRR
jgi:predicted amidohydrolase